nr:HNH endonuclease [Chloroflexota bacterium]
RYGIPNEPGKHEVDHFISLELGGSNMVTNLWPEPYVTSDAPNTIGAHEKDKVENALHAEVCAGRMTLPQAQETIRTDWYAYFLKIAK